VREGNVLAVLSGKRYCYEIIEGGSVSGGQDFADEQFDMRLIDSGQLPASVCEAPLASWVLARLSEETEGCLGLAKEERVDGGGFAMDVVVRDSTSAVVAGFQLQGDTFGAAILGSCTKSTKADDVLDDFGKLLLREPQSLAMCRIRIYDPEWKDEPEDYEPTPKRCTRNKYGWDGKQFLGADNVWCASTCNHERPDSYSEYLRTAYHAWKQRSVDDHN
jgi:hypothetical protein